jgi:hypothetical protein
MHLISLFIYLYFGVGTVFAIAFVLKGVTAIDPTARTGATRGFRLLIFPGAVALWPFMAKRWLGGQVQPPEEKSPHRCAACKACSKSESKA